MKSFIPAREPSSCHFGYAQEDFLLCMHKRMEGILHEAEANADLMAPGLSAAAIPGQAWTSLVVACLEAALSLLEGKSPGLAC